MTQDEKNAEIGIALSAYNDAAAVISCMNMRLDRLDAALDERKHLESQPHPTVDELELIGEKAVSSLEGMSLAEVVEHLNKARRECNNQLRRLHALGVGDSVRTKL